MKLPPIVSVKQGWPREKMIAQWMNVLHNPRNSRYPMVLQLAAEALRYLGADRDREPGADDEALAA